MSENESLKNKLERLAEDSTEVVDGWRRIGRGAPVSVAVATEIDETVLPRHLTFRNVAGDGLTVEAGHRRLRRFLPPIPDPLRPWAAVFEAARLDSAVEPETVGALFRAHFSDTDAAWVRSAPLPLDGGGGGQGGLSRAAILSAWDIAGQEREPIDPEEAVDAVLDEIARRSIAWVVLGEGVVEAQSEDATPLSAIAAATWRASIGDDAREDAICCVLGQGADGSLVLAGDAERAIVAQMTAEAASEIPELWRAAWA